MVGLHISCLSVLPLGDWSMSTYETPGKSLAEPTYSASGARHVLIVDDDIDFAETIADMLEPDGYVVYLAHNFSDALKALDEFTPHVALLDIRLGRDCGTDLISLLQERFPKILCIMMTGYAALETAIKALKDGAYDYMRKPISPDDLFHTLNRCFQTVELVREKQQADQILSQRNQDLEKINDRLRDVVRAAEKLASCTQFDELGPMLLKEFSSILLAHGGSLYLFSDEGLSLVHTLELPHTPRFIEMPLAEDSVFHHVLTHREPLLIYDFKQSPFRRSKWDGYEDGSSLVFPILSSEGEVLAVISLHNKEMPPFTEHDKEVGTILLSLSGEVLRTLKAFDEVAESRRRFRELTDMLPAIVFELDAEGRFTYLNREVANISGYTPLELLGRELSTLIPGLDQERLLSYLADTHHNGSDDDDFPLRHKDGQMRTVLLQSARIERDGEIIGTRGLCFDITQRKQTEMEHAQLAMAVEQAAELILITDVNGRILYANPAFLALTGYTASAVQSLNFHNFENAKDDPTFYEKLWETLKRGLVWHGRVRGYKADEAVYVADASISPLRDVNGHVSNYVAVMRDLTNEVKLELRLRQAEKLEAIGTLAGGIAHDFNNILSPIIGFTEIVREDLPPRSDSIPHLEKVLNACHMAKELVARILTFSRQVESERKAVSVYQIVREALKLLRPSIPSTIAIREDIDPESGVVLADPSQVHQLIMNLGTNAYQALENEGTISVKLFAQVATAELARELLRLHEGSDYICLEVHDTGVGMDKHVLERIFDPFFSTKDQGKGTGLGLATVHGIVMELGGDISVASEVGKGTTVKVYLPIHLVEDESEGQTEQTTLRKGKGRILFVDDEEMILQLGEMMLGRLGYEVISYCISPDALEHFRDHADDYDLLITDQTMPSMTGQQLAEAIKDIRPNMPILLTTGFSSLVKEEQLEKIGIHQVVHKPFTRKEMSDAILAALQSVQGG